MKRFLTPKESSACLPANVVGDDGISANFLINTRCKCPPAVPAAAAAIIKQNEVAKDGKKGKKHISVTFKESKIAGIGHNKRSSSQ